MHALACLEVYQAPRPARHGCCEKSRNSHAACAPLPRLIVERELRRLSNCFIRRRVGKQIAHGLL